MEQVFKLHDTHGLPILDIAELLDMEGIAVNWLEWTKDAIKAGWTYQRIEKTITHVNDNLYGDKWHTHKKNIPVMYLVLTRPL